MNKFTDFKQILRDVIKAPLRRGVYCVTPMVQITYISFWMKMNLTRFPF